MNDPYIVLIFTIYPFPSLMDSNVVKDGLVVVFVELTFLAFI